MIPYTITETFNGSTCEYGDYYSLSGCYEFFILNGKLVNQRYTLSELNKEPNYKACNIMISIGRDAYIKTTYDNHFRVYDGTLSIVNYDEALEWLSNYVPEGKRLNVISRTLAIYAIGRSRFTAPADYF